MGSMPWKDFGMYALVQTLGAALAAFIYQGLFWSSFNLRPAKYGTPVDMDGAEVFYTFMLIFVYLNVTATEKSAFMQDNSFYGLAISFVMVAGVYAAGPISGGCFNPAEAIGIDTASFTMGWGWCLSYVAYELIASAMAVTAFRVCRPEEFGKERTLIAECMSEFLGTFFLVSTVGLNTLARCASGPCSVATEYMCMVYALHDVSGAYFNPAATLAAMAGKGADGNLPAGKAFKFMAVQFVGGIAGASYFMMLALRQFGKTGAEASMYPSLGPTQDNWHRFLFAETVFTFVLCYVVLAAACSIRKSKVMFGLSVGSCCSVGANEGCAFTHASLRLGSARRNLTRESCEYRVGYPSTPVGMNVVSPPGPSTHWD